MTFHRVFHHLRRTNIRHVLYVFVAVVLSLGVSAYDKVVIQKPYHPYFVYHGTNATFVCQSGHNRELHWFRGTKLSSWDEMGVNATADNGFIIKKTHEVPSGKVESFLTKVGLRTSDTGMYICRDTDAINSYAAWLIVLIIFKEDVMHTYSPSFDNESVKLSCKMSGFYSNPPMMRKEWYFMGQKLPAMSDKYTVSDQDTSLNLLILNPGRADVGSYECRFSIPTDNDPVVFRETILLNVTGLPPEDDLSSCSRCRLSWNAAFIGLLFVTIMY